ncbi:type II toxin-antitoxin system HicB family antitoxin, partial [Patescibacteria group bacterium]|nr:type II toxin-antitoxin system HicB family antitoxin [Patescibacteria group bacterium]
MAKKLQQFKIIIEQDEDGYFVGSVPSLPGCHTQAKTLTELNKRIREAILLCREVAKTD